MILYGVRSLAYTCVCQVAKDIANRPVFVRENEIRLALGMQLTLAYDELKDYTGMSCGNHEMTLANSNARPK